MQNKQSQRFTDTSYWGKKFVQNNPNWDGDFDIYQSSDFPHVFLGGENELEEIQNKTGHSACMTVDCRDLPEISFSQPFWNIEKYREVEEQFRQKVKHTMNIISNVKCPVFVHCVAGMNRSVSVLASAISLLSGKSVDAILHEMKLKRNIINPQDPYYLMSIHLTSPDESHKQQLFDHLDINKSRSLVSAEKRYAMKTPNWLSKIMIDEDIKDLWRMIDRSFDLMSHESYGTFMPLNDPVLGKRSYMNSSKNVRIEIQLNIYWPKDIYVLLMVMSQQDGAFKFDSDTFQDEYKKFKQTPYNLVKKTYELLDRMEEGDDDNDGGSEVEPEYGPSPFSGGGIRNHVLAQRSNRPPDYVGIGHGYNWDTGDSRYVEEYRHKSEVQLWCFENGQLEIFDRTKPNTNHISETYDAKGRVDNVSGIGSIVFDSTDIHVQKHIIEKLLEKFPSIKFYIYARGGPYSVQEYWDRKLN